MIQRVILVILDSLGVGALPDAKNYNDEGSHTLGHIFQERGHLHIPYLCALGLGRISALGCSDSKVLGCFGKMAESSAGKDTTIGHWEIAGVISKAPPPVFPVGFPQDIINAFESAIGCKTLGNYPESGTRIIAELGPEHLETGFPIVYTSADSVFQIATHEAVIPIETLYEYCATARKLLSGPYAVGRVIARPFRGKPDHFERINAARKDFSLLPPQETLLDRLKSKNLFTAGIGKIGDIFGHQGLTMELPTKNNADGIHQTLTLMRKLQDESGLIFLNLVDFDMIFGHRRDVEGYARTLEAFDMALADFLPALTETDLLIITADHGCDPTHRIHTDHTREYVPLLVYGKAIQSNVNLGVRTTFADCGQTIADLLGAGRLPHGISFRKEIMHE